MNQPLVSIVINNYNYGDFLGDAIDSALNQSYSHTEIIVVDDGSTDNSCNVIASYENQIFPIFKKNGGQASAFNAGFAASQGDIICFLDSDDIFLPEKVKKITEIFQAYSDSHWCFHSLKLVRIESKIFFENSHKYVSQEYDFREEIRKKGKLHFNHPATSGLCFKRLLLKQILPMPEAQNVSIGDHYLKFTASALSKGFFLDQELAIQRLHNDNAYTQRNDEHKQETKAKIFILTAYWMRYKFPEFRNYTNKVFAKGLSILWQNKRLEEEYKNFIEEYISQSLALEKLEINFRAFYHYLKVKAGKSIPY